MGGPTSLQEHMLRMFIWLRLGVGSVGISLPVILALWGYARYGVELPGSMSAYYHATAACSGQVSADSLTAARNHDPSGIAPACLSIGIGPMRNWFVGNLFFFGGAMLLMRGFSRWESWLLDVAGFTALGVALFPMNWGKEINFNPHLTFAITFLVCVGITCVFCSRKTLKEIPPDYPNREKVINFYKRW